MRNYVSKVLLGIDTKNVKTTDDIALEALTDRQIIAFDWDTLLGLVAGTTNIGFARGTATLGEALVVGPIPKAGIVSAILNPYKAAIKQKITLTVTTVPTVGKTGLFKISYHDNLSVIPNQIKQTIIALQADATNTATTTTWAAAIAAEFVKQVVDGNMFVLVTTATNVVTFESLTILTASAYNRIDRPETVIFEIGAPDESGYGVYAVAQTVAPALGQGDPAKMAWIEDNAMGRFGHSDRRRWDNTRKYTPQVVAGETYDTLVISANIKVEGDLQGVRENPIGVVIGGESDTLALILTDLATAGVVPVTVAAG
ncbi:MAG TPA: hypothetical protein ENI20_16570 [Bacteroides sp.]|nr:hypothetical protein [Bacteroides sp.]